MISWLTPSLDSVAPYACPHYSTYAISMKLLVNVSVSPVRLASGRDGILLVSPAH